MSEGAGVEAVEPQPAGVRKSVEVNGRKWEYLEYGNPAGKPILNIHGWLGSAEGNEKLSLALTGQIQDSVGMKTLDRDLPRGAKKIRESIGELDGKYHIVSPELPGFGKTEAMSNPSTDRMADELADFQKALGIEKSVVFGSSGGAVLAIKLASRHPEAVNALVLQGLATRPEDINKSIYLRLRVVTFPLIALSLEMAPKALRRGILKLLASATKDFKEAGKDLQNIILDNAKTANAHTALKTLKEATQNIEGSVDKIQAPIVVLDGASGDLVPITKAKEIAGRFHPEENNLQQKIAKRKLMYFQIGGVTGKHSHNVINTFPEAVAVLINHAVNKYFPPK